MKDLFHRFASWCGFFRCPLCMEHSGNGRNEICPECREKLPLLPTHNRCPGCGGQNNSALAVCSACMEFPMRAYIDAVAVMEYSGAGREMIRDLKFRNHPELARPLAMLAVEKLHESSLVFDVIVPIPLHWQRKLSRSYNQSELLASIIAGETGKPLVHGLKRIYPTPRQSGLKKELRQKNMKRALAVKNSSFAGKQVLLVDDVLTTGTTLSTAAKVLMDNGAAAVRVLCCARTPLKRNLQ